MSNCADAPNWMDVLVDILLSLLGRAGDALPFGPLRESCKALFRAFAEQVTPQGFGDLIRVVRQTPEGKTDEEEDEDDDMFEEDEEEEETPAGLPLSLIRLWRFSKYFCCAIVLP